MEMLVILFVFVLIVLSNLPSDQEANVSDGEDHRYDDNPKHQYLRNGWGHLGEVGTMDVVTLSAHPELDISGAYVNSPITIENEETERMVFGNSFGPYI